MTRRKSHPLIKITRWLVPLLISAAAFWLILRNVDLSQFLNNLSRVGIKALFLSSLVYFASLLMRVLCWFILLKGKVSYKDAFFTMNAGYLLNNVFPFRLGELGRALLLADPQGPTALAALSSVIVERVFDVFLAAVFVVGLLPRLFAAGYDQNLFLIIFIITTLGMITLYLAARFRTRILTWLTRWGKRAAFIENWLKPKAAQLLEGLSVLDKPVSFLFAFGSLLISWVLAFYQNFIIFNALYSKPPFWWLIFVLSAGALGMALPSAPAGLGVFEGAMVAAFALLSVDADTALAHAILIHGMSFVYSNIFGLIGLHIRGEALIGLYQRVIRRTPEVQTTK